MFREMLPAQCCSLGCPLGICCLRSFSKVARVRLGAGRVIFEKALRIELILFQLKLNGDGPSSFAMHASEANAEEVSLRGTESSSR